MSRPFALAACLIATVTITAAAQPAPAIAAGQRVRITDDSGTQIGTVIAVTADNIRVTDGAREQTITLTGARRIEVSKGGSNRGASAKKGAIRGAIISGAIGAILLGLQHEQVGDNGSSFGKAAALGAWSGGLFGGLIGAGIGAARAGEQWEQVWPYRNNK